MLSRLCFALLVITACKDTSDKHAEPAPAPFVTEGSAGSAAVEAKGSGSDEEYVAAEFKNGMARWKDTVVYLDGKPLGYLQFGELPITLKPTWVKSKKSIDKPAGCPTCPAWAWGEQRFYKFTDYLKAIGVDIKKIKQIHVQGPRVTDTIVATAKDLQSPAADQFMFRFGSEVSGKAIPHVPPNFGNGLGPDKITSVMIYVDRKPPTFDDEGYVLDGQPIEGVPYFGEPLRGGIRVYLDDKLAAIIKRNDLDSKLATTASDGELAWSLYGFLKKNGVDTSKVVEGWVIRDEKRNEKIPASELAQMSFEAASKSGKSENGAVLLGPHKLVTQSLALHTRAIAPDELPVIRPEEQD